MALDVWSYSETVLGSDINKANIVGYGVEAFDGSIGKVDEATYDAGSAFIVRGHRPVDLRQEGHAPSRHRHERRSRRREDLRQPNERTRSRMRRSSTTPSRRTGSIAGSLAPTTALAALATATDPGD